MAKHRTHSIEFKRQVVHEFLGGESPHALAKRHGVSRNLIKIWVAKYEAGGLDSDAAAADVLADYEARIAALERLVGKLDRFRSPVAGPQQPRPGFVAYYVRVWGVSGGCRHEEAPAGQRRSSNTDRKSRTRGRLAHSATRLR